MTFAPIICPTNDRILLNIHSRLHQTIANKSITYGSASFLPSSCSNVLQVACMSSFKVDEPLQMPNDIQDHSKGFSTTESSVASCCKSVCDLSYMS